MSNKKTKPTDRTKSRSNNHQGKSERIPKRDSERRDDPKTESQAPSKDRLVNDPQWWTGKYEEAAKAAAQVIYSWPVGTKLPNYAFTHSIADTHWKGDSIPGFMVLDINICPGISTTGDSPVMTAARNLYSWVRHVNSGHTNYEATDLMMYVLAMDSIYSLYEWAARAYSFARTYSQINRYFAEAALTCMRFDPNSVMNNLQNFRSILEVTAIKMASLCVPSNIPIFERHRALFRDIYCDSDSAKCQCYLLRPHGYYEYLPVTEQTGGMLKFHQMAELGGALTVEDIGNLFNRLISKVMEDEDMNIMSGDILKAFGSENIFKVNIPAYDEIRVPFYSEEILSQIDNIITTGPIRSGTGNITQENGIILYNPTFRDQSPAAVNSAFITMKKNDPDYSDTMVATRLCQPMEVVGELSDYTIGQDVYMKAQALGTDYCTYWQIVAYVWDANDQRQLRAANWPHLSGGAMPVMETFMPVTVSSEPKATSLEMNFLHNLATFDYHPKFCPVDPNFTHSTWEGGITYYGYMNDVDTYGFISNEVLTRIHEAALLNAYAVPTMGAYSPQHGYSKLGSKKG